MGQRGIQEYIHVPAYSAIAADSSYLVCHFCNRVVLYDAESKFARN